MGLPVNRIAADILRIKDGVLAEHWDVIPGRSQQGTIKEWAAHVWRKLHKVSGTGLCMGPPEEFRRALSAGRGERRDGDNYQKRLD